MLYTIHMRLKEVFNTPKTALFANINMVLVGDLLQISPVQGTLVFKTPLNLKYKANKDNLDLWNNFEPMILKHNHRQGDEKVWADALNQFREGIVSEEGEALLRERLTSEAFLDENSMHIFYMNKNVKNLNDKMLNSVQSELESHTVTHRLPLGCRAYVDPNKGTIGNTQFLEVLNIKIGARVTLIYNVNIVDDLVNGSYGTVIGIEKTSSGRIRCIVVKFDDATTGQEQRQRFPIESGKYRQQNGTPIFPIHFEYNVVSKRGYGHTAKAILIQFPLNLCYAQTAHRMQGQTVRAGTKVVLHWSKRMQNGMAYVMLGRSVRREDLYIAEELDLSQIRCDQEALEESKRLLKIFDEKAMAMFEQRSKVWKISYLNVRSLVGHQDDVRIDNCLMDSDMLGLGETWLEENSTINIQGYSGYFANHGKGKGVAGYTKMELISLPQIIKTNSASAIMFRTNAFDIIFLYLSKGYAKDFIFNQVDTWVEPKKATAVIGDINENVLDTSKFETFMKGKKFSQLVKVPTHESGSLLDHIYINNALEQRAFSTQNDACYFSDHDIVSLFVSK